ncbi:MAG: PAS domain-containing protein [Pseudolabrys sp.]|nr:PAS domain-containing protein [Pseudolabrys sp.]
MTVGRPATKQVAIMRHTSSRELYAYWNTQRGERPAPERADIDPAAIRHALGDVFILAADFVDERRFRLAGTRVCALFTRELKGEAFGGLFDDASRRLTQDLLNVVTGENSGAVAGVTGMTADGDKLDLELLLLPLAHQGHARVRAVGVLAPSKAPFWIGEKPLQSLALGALRHVGPDIDQLGGRRFVTGAGAGLVNGTADIKIRRGFRVYQGGRDNPSPSEQAG